MVAVMSDIVLFIGRFFFSLSFQHFSDYWKYNLLMLVKEGRAI